MDTQNLFEDFPASDDEIFEELMAGRQFKLERIVSTGQATPEGEWLQQAKDEWVVLLSGAATLSFQDPARHVDLVPGDFVHSPGKLRHRVEQTAENETTVWLALHFVP